MAKSKEDIKFTEEELKTIKEFQKKYLDIQMGFGQGEITRSRLESQLDTVYQAVEDLKEKLLSVQEEEKTFISDINKKYGDGVLDPQTGIFKPSKT